uniref:Cytochrome c oxidase subunit 3 n=1 Tax=Dryinus sp. ZJUH_2016011 TaxID=2491175 RepID=A0A3S8V0M4_9HYME|nr:cytochrome c oxidase subunit 3 [Dryinus sp. ZJUH_2016011]
MFHLVTNSPWPLIMSLNLMNLFLSSIMFMTSMNKFMIIFNLMLSIMIMFQWWRDMIRESTLQGMHTNKVCLGIKMGMILFIISEIFFFMSFFWVYFDILLSQDIELGLKFPPMGVTPFNPFNIPLLNTLILLSSGISVTWTHNSIINNMYINSIFSLIITIILGIYFTLMQIYEYVEAPFSMSDSLYGSIFFTATGFHGLHVCMGTIFLMIALKRLLKKEFSSIHHLNFESSSWYWHFVDVVWLFLYLFMYWLPT